MDDDVESIGGIGCAELEEEGLPPNVKPSRKLRCPGPGEAEGIGTPSGSGEPKSMSCAPSSAIAVEGNVPGRGKNTERLRECTRECRRPCACAEIDGEELMPLPFSFVRSSGAVVEVGNLPEDDGCGGNENDNGEGLAGENGPEMDLVLECELPGSDKD